jgi:hypothetical protein
MFRSSKSKGKKLSFHYFPCLRCGQLTVTALVQQPFERLELPDLTCKRCCTRHFLVAENRDDMWWAVYDRDTRQYPGEFYDEMPFALVKFKGVALSRPEDDDAPFPGHGPIMVFKRKQFSAAVETIWINSDQRCHECKKEWKLSQRSRTGWHIDHVIPNCGGGRDTEMMDNFRVACACCNLKKGGGPKVRLIKEALRRLFV